MFCPFPPPPLSPLRLCLLNIHGSFPRLTEFVRSFVRSFSRGINPLRLILFASHSPLSLECAFARPFFAVSRNRRKFLPRSALSTQQIMTVDLLANIGRTGGLLLLESAVSLPPSPLSSGYPWQIYWTGWARDQINSGMRVDFLREN